MKLRMLSILTIVFALAAVGCGSDEGDDDNNNGGSGNGASGNGASGSGNDIDAGGTGNGPTSFKAELQDPTAHVAIQDAHEIIVVDNDTGEPTGKKAMSGADGAVSIEDMPAGKVGFLVKGIAAKTIDTYQFNIDARAQNETLWAVAKTTAMIVPNLAGFTPDKTKGSISGAIYWVNDAGEEEKVGCATVAFAGTGDAGDVRYFSDNDLPTTIAMRDSTNLINGRYFVGNAPTGVQSVKVMIDGKELGSTSLPLFARQDATDGEDNVCISNIYIEADENPTPAGCK